MMSDTIKLFNDWFAAIFTDYVAVLIEAFGLYFAKKILPGF